MSALIGDHPGRVRLEVEEGSGADQLGLVYGIRCRHYSAAATAALVYPAQSLTPLDAAANATVNSVACVRHQSLAAAWTPVLSTNLTAGTFLTHTGTYRVWARVYSTSAVPPSVRFIYDVGDMTNPEENASVAIPAASNFYLLDLGQVRLDKGPAGTHRWQGVIQAKGAVGGENVSIARLWLVPVDEGYGKLRAPKPPLDALLSFGTPGTGDGQFADPAAIALDSAGNIWVADASNNRVQKFNPAGTLLLKFGTYGTANGQFNNPQGIACDSADNVYVTDRDNNRVQKFNSAGTYTTKWGTAGTGNGQFNAAWGIAIDSSNNVYVGDFINNRVQRFNSAGTYVSQFGTAGSGNGQFNFVRGVDTDAAGNVWVADANNNRVQKFNSSGTYQSQFGTVGSALGNLYSPSGIAIDSSGNVYVSDTSNYRVQKFNSSGVAVLAFGGHGTDSGQFGSVYGVAVDATHNVYVVDTANNRVEKFSATTINNLLIADAVIYADQQVELNTFGCSRETADGTGWGPTSPPVGDLLRVPPSGLEGRPVELFLKASHGDLDQLPDVSNGDDLSVTPFIRPSWLITPGS